jgi:hypothetical protein
MSARISWFFDCHSHKQIRINHDPDVAGMARTFAECGIEEVTIHAKDHTGFAYYPSRIGTPHPKMLGDAFGDAAAACVQHGVDILAYVSFGIDGEAGRRHHDWVQVRPEGRILNDDWFVSVCPFTPYLDALMLPMIAEILDDYPVNGFFFDTMNSLGTCCCETCTRDFRDAHGVPIPHEEDDPNWGIYGQFRRARGMTLLDRVSRFIKDRKPDATVGFNQVGTIRFPERLPDGINRLTLDFHTFSQQSRQASMSAAYGSTTGIEAEIFVTIFNQGWGDWSPRPMLGLEQAMIPIWARKCQPTLGDRLRPENRLGSASINAMAFVARLKGRVVAAFPPSEARLKPDVLLLHTPGQMYGADMRRFGDYSTGVRPVAGAHHLLLDCGANFAIAAEDYLDDELLSVHLVVLPELESIAASTDRRLREYVEGGGRVLVVGHQPIDWLGLEPKAEPWQDHVWLPPWTDEMDPVLVVGDYYECAATGAKVVVQAIRPYDCAHGVRYGWGIGPAEMVLSGVPLLTRYGLGKGEVWCLAAPICSDYEQHANWTQIAWMRELLRRIVPTPAARVVSDSGAVEVVLHRTEQSTWLILINHGGEQLNGDGRWSRVLPPLPAYPYTLEVRDGESRKPESVVCGDELVPYDFVDDVITVRGVLDTGWRVVRVDWAGE